MGKHRVSFGRHSTFQLSGALGYPTPASKHYTGRHRAAARTPQALNNGLRDTPTVVMSAPVPPVVPGPSAPAPDETAVIDLRDPLIPLTETERAKLITA